MSTTGAHESETKPNNVQMLTNAVDKSAAHALNPANNSPTTNVVSTKAQQHTDTPLATNSVTSKLESTVQFNLPSTNAAQSEASNINVVSTSTTAPQQNNSNVQTTTNKPAEKKRTGSDSEDDDGAEEVSLIYNIPIH